MSNYHPQVSQVKCSSIATCRVSAYLVKKKILATKQGKKTTKKGTLTAPKTHLQTQTCLPLLSLATDIVRAATRASAFARVSSYMVWMSKYQLPLNVCNMWLLESKVFSVTAVLQLGMEGKYSVSCDRSQETKK